MSELHIRKVRETETGGRPTSLDDPYKLSMNISHTGFTSWIGGRKLFQPIEFEQPKSLPLNLNFST